METETTKQWNEEKRINPPQISISRVNDVIGLLTLLFWLSIYASD